MRKNITIIALVFLLILPSLASAVYLDSVSGTADCNGWNAEVEITFRSGARLVRLEYAVVLMDANGVELERFDYATEVEIPSETTMVYPFGDAWSTSLADGLHTMTFDLVLYDIYPDGQNRFEDGFSTDFVCDEGTGGEDPIVTGFCPRGPGYWKNNPTDWPVMNLDLGGVNLDQTALLNILSASPRGDTTFILARALITAKLNMAAGAGDGISDVIAEADAFLADHPVGSNPTKPARKTALSFMSELGKYNSGDCEDDTDTAGDSHAPKSGKYETMGYDKAAAIDLISLGSLKALYR